MPTATYLGALGFAFGAGAVTFFSPCAYPLLPGYVGYFVHAADRETESPVRGALVRGAAAAAGVLAVFAVLVGAVYVFGQVAVAPLETVEPAIGALLVALGVVTILDRGPSVHRSLPARRRSVAGFALFGGAYAVAAAGCVLPVVSAVVLQALQFPPGPSALVIVAYAIGVCGLMLVVTVLSAVGVDLGRPVTARFGLVNRLAGGVMVLAGLWQIYRAVFVLHLL